MKGRRDQDFPMDHKIVFLKRLWRITFLTLIIFSFQLIELVTSGFRETARNTSHAEGKSAAVGHL
jgi:hypothetical protein